ncbi:MAG: hypothetical protein WCP74_10175 [Sphingobacteriia bacterium]
MIQLTLNRKMPFLLGVLLTLVTSCTSVRLVSEYDEITDKAVIALQKKVSTTFVKLENDIGTDKAKYENYKGFYQNAKVDLNTLKVRADAIDKNNIVQDQIAALTSMLDNLEKLHKIGFSSVDQITPLKQPFNSAFTAIIKFQMALKRGEKRK